MGREQEGKRPFGRVMPGELTKEQREAQAAVLERNARIALAEAAALRSFDDSTKVAYRILTYCGRDFWMLDTLKRSGIRAGAAKPFTTSYGTITSVTCAPTVELDKAAQGEREEY